jgi:ATP-dependent Clp protease ATP-binding subunit ClpX
MDDVEFTINDEALDIVDKGLEYKLGARGLRSLCEAVLTDAMYEYQVLMQTLKIDLEYAKKPNKNLLAKSFLLKITFSQKKNLFSHLNRFFLCII